MQQRNQQHRAAPGIARAMPAQLPDGTTSVTGPRVTLTIFLDRIAAPVDADCSAVRWLQGPRWALHSRLPSYIARRARQAPVRAKDGKRIANEAMDSAVVLDDPTEA